MSRSAYNVRLYINDRTGECSLGNALRLRKIMSDQGHEWVRTPTAPLLSKIRKAAVNGRLTTEIGIVAQRRG